MMLFGVAVDSPPPLSSAGAGEETAHALQHEQSPFGEGAFKEDDDLLAAHLIDAFTDAFDDAREEQEQEQEQATAASAAAVALRAADAHVFEEVEAATEIEAAAAAAAGRVPPAADPACLPPQKRMRASAFDATAAHGDAHEETTKEEEGSGDEAAEQESAPGHVTAFAPVLPPLVTNETFRPAPAVLPAVGYICAEAPQLPVPLPFTMGVWDDEATRRRQNRRLRLRCMRECGQTVPVIYEGRSEVAQRRPRMGGRFAPAKHMISATEQGSLLDAQMKRTGPL